METKVLFLVAVVVVLSLARSIQGQHTTPMPTSTPSEPVKQTFFLKENISNKSVVCLRMVVAIVVNFTYTTDKKENETQLVVVTGGAGAIVDEDRSSCNSSAREATLYLVSEMDEVEIIFFFGGNKDKWFMEHSKLSVDPTILDGSAVTEDRVHFNGTNDLLTDPNNQIEYSRSYICNSNTQLDFGGVDKIYPVVTISDLQVQAFQFNNNTSGAFDNARQCLADTSGKANKIVPIAVGAALAGLVIVVLVAYLIGRLRSRRQSSYEALS